MTDEEYVFYKENAEKAVTARSAHNKSGTKKRWTMPSQSEVNKIMSESKTYTVEPGRFLRYDAFRALPEDMQQYYLMQLVDRYNVTAKEVASAWYLSPSCVSKVFKNLSVNRPKGVRMTEEQKERWSAFVSGECFVAGVVQVKPEPKAEDKPGVIVETLDNPKPMFALDGAKFAFTTYDKEKICAVLDSVAGDGEYKVIVELIRA